MQSRLEKFWYVASPWKFLFYPFSLIIELLVTIKRFLYRVNILTIHQFDVPVIVVGNITLGGTGKTPFIAHLASQMRARGLRVGLVSRGYKASISKFPHFVGFSDKVEEIGDEAYMQYRNLQLPMAIDPSRPRAVKALAENFPLDLIISDDGMQHYAMARDFEILMLDGKRLFGNRLMLPFGPLREPVRRCKNVDYIVCTSVDNADNPEANNQANNQLNNLKINISCSKMYFKVTGLVHIKSAETVSLNNLKQHKISALAGIGNPHRFFETLSAYVNNFEKNIFPDHHAFTENDFKNIQADIIIMTEKDAVKCYSFAKENWYYLKVEAFLPEKQFAKLYTKINKKLLQNV